MNKEVKSASDDQITKEELAMHFYRVLRTQSGNYSESQINSNPKLRQRIIEET